MTGDRRPAQCILIALLIIVLSGALTGCVMAPTSQPNPTTTPAARAQGASDAKRTFLLRLIGFCAGVNERVKQADQREGASPSHAADELQKLIGQALTAGVPAQDRQKFDAFIAAVATLVQRLPEQQTSGAGSGSRQAKAVDTALTTADEAGMAYGMPHLSECGKDAGTGTWKAREALPISLQQIGSTVLGGSIWVAGGLTGEAKASATTFVYDPVLDKWSKGPDLPEPLHHAMAVSYHAEVVVIGGWIPSGDDVRATTSSRVMALQGGKWTDFPALHHARAAGAATVVGDRIVVTGGTNGKLVDATEVFDGTSWKDAARLPVPGDHLAAVSDGKAAYLVGGRALTSDKNSAALQRFDPASGKWTQLPQMPTPRGGLGAALVDGKIYAVGGESVTSAFDTVEYYDIASRSWTTGTPLPKGRHGLGVAALGQTLYAVAGAAQPMHHNSSSDVTALDLTAAPPAVSVTTSASATDLLAACPKSTSKHWACLKSAHAHGKALTIVYTTNFPMDGVKSVHGDHLHLWTAEPDGKGGTKPPAEVMQHMVAKPGSWVILYDKKVKELDSRTARGGQEKPLDTSASLLCVRVASGAHMLATDRKGGLTTGNCVPITDGP